MKYSNKYHFSIKGFKEKIKSTKRPSKFMIIILGIASTLWVLIRVIPKPQRAGYPCVRAAAPIMSSFLIYIFSLGGITLLFKKAVAKFKRAKYMSAVFSICLCFVLLLVFNWNYAQRVYSKTVGFTRSVVPDGPNNPMGEGVGINPGRVVWSWDSNATNENCKNTIVSTGGWFDAKMDWDKSDAFFMPKNNNQEVINTMMDSSIISLAGTKNVKDAWDSIFKDFNKRKSGNDSGYTNGQTIFFKVNNGQAGWAINGSDLSERGNNSQMTGVKGAAMSGTTPATVLALIRQLVDDCGIPQEVIYVGEPMTHVYKSMHDVITNEYPNINILDKDGNTHLGRIKSKGWTDQVIFYSDKGDEMPDAISDDLMIEMYEADYLINASALKAHARNGFSACAKLHFGSHGDHPNGYGYGSFYLHSGLICTVDNDVMTSGVRGEYGQYRVLTDLMGHEKIGRNTILFLIDALWSGVEATDMPVKWNMAPFNGDFPNSIFLSQDGVAIESVGLDFLRAEAEVNELFNDRPFFPAVDDHLHQAADKSNWTDGFIYDPENDGTEIPSLGVHEHWNNAEDMMYSRNLGENQGIELVKIEGTKVGKTTLSHRFDLKAFPNPCSDVLNLQLNLPKQSNLSIELVSLNGQVNKLYEGKNAAAEIIQKTFDVSQFQRGVYICKISLTTIDGTTHQNTKITIR